MAPLTLKTTLALLAASGAATSSVAARKNYGKHMKMVRRTGAGAGANGLFEDLDKRENDAPYGYDRCGVARTKPYVRKTGNGASPSPSKQYKPCPDGSPGASQAAARKQAAAPTPAPNGDGSHNNGGQDSGPTTQYHDGSDDGNGEAADGESGQGDDDEDDGGVYYIAPSGDIVRIAGDGSTQTGYTTQYVDVTSYTTEYTDPTTTSEMSSSPAPSADGSGDSSSSSGGNTFSPNAPNVKVVNGAGQPPSSSSSSSSNTWEDSQPTWTPEAQAPASSSSSWTPEPAPSSSSSQWTPPNAQIKVPAPSSSSSSEPAPSPSPESPPPTSNVGRAYGAMGLAWDWQNPKGVLHNWCGKNSKIYTWSAYPPSDPLCDGMEWYPQYWGPAKQGEFEANVASGIIRPGMTILGYNEPDQPGQANLGVWDAIGSYKAQITKYASQGYRITTPGCTSDENGFQWLSQFIAGCAGTCGFTAIQTHFYGTDADAFIAYIQRIHNAWPEFPIIISEYAAETFGHGADLTAQGSMDYLYKTQNWLKQQSYVDSYFFFGPLTTKAANGVNHNNLLINDDGSVKPIGWQYKNDA